jgi:hypothetical protein
MLCLLSYGHHEIRTGVWRPSWTAADTLSAPRECTRPRFVAGFRRPPEPRSSSALHALSDRVGPRTSTPAGEVGCDQVVDAGWQQPRQDADVSKLGVDAARGPPRQEDPAGDPARLARWFGGDPGGCGRGGPGRVHDPSPQRVGPRGPERSHSRWRELATLPFRSPSVELDDVMATRIDEFAAFMERCGGCWQLSAWRSTIGTTKARSGYGPTWRSRTQQIPCVNPVGPGGTGMMLP